jgi:BirA family biotin operon repressor/biotin-[acetyl-CoA-carboxylase] ligase
VALASVDSTNAEAARRAGGGAAPLWIMAGEQTGGRGRRGRPWSSPRGNFHATLLLHPAGPPDVVALRSFVAALALRDACVSLTGQPAAFTLKWPNDVLLNGGKLAGILLEGAGEGAGMSHLAIGIGVNLIAAPDPGMVEPGALRPVSLLQETGIRLSPERFLQALAPAYARRESTFCTQGFAPLRLDWLAHAARLGQPIRARTGVSTQDGIFETIDPGGALVLRTATATLAIPAAEVFF